MKNRSDALLPLQLDEFLIPILSGDPRSDLIEFFQKAFTLTVLDPRPFATPLESPWERVEHLRFLCQGHGLSDEGWQTLLRKGVRSVTHLVLLARASSIKSGFSVDDRIALTKIQALLEEKQPLEPLHSFKRYWAHLKELPKNRPHQVPWMDLASVKNGKKRLPIDNSNGRLGTKPLAHSEKLVSPMLSTTLEFPQRRKSKGPDSLHVDAPNFVPKPKPKPMVPPPPPRYPFKRNGYNVPLVCRRCEEKFCSNGIAYEYCQVCWHTYKARSSYCQNALHGCAFTGTMGQLEKHLAHCRYQPSYCPFFGCHFSCPSLIELKHHLERSHWYNREMLTLTEVIPANPNVSREAKLVLQIPGRALLRRDEETLLPSYWLDPPEFIFDNLIFYVVLCCRNAQSYSENNYNTKRYFFWIYTLSNVETANQYHFEISILNSSRQPFWSRGMCQSVRRPFGEIMRRFQRSFHEIVALPQAQLKNAVNQEGLINCQLKIYKF
ncbi:hypothetical protein TCAL_11981 [Tigriopus californicus]|uniref:SIAH-type domain-containing protein n=1 Tax=Tigriopus californicus TaxID=6832 RepID=A0A553NVX2_TIGCA|nr:uncharacterized protein LOC131877529 isoform X1 [Tigriopus californicus]TRY69582.1 hypothetical protein TCAL_11981 [Tigriopus californicus]|eukprot:TCALIF_11981-PA protein Name:"Protein of unknown function" AED:0.00 eAED:0.00 QI:152/1/1/1/0.5/0.66/3/190/492